MLGKPLCIYAFYTEQSIHTWSVSYLGAVQYTVQCTVLRADWEFTVEDACPDSAGAHIQTVSNPP